MPRCVGGWRGPLTSGRHKLNLEGTACVLGKRGFYLTPGTHQLLQLRPGGEGLREAGAGGGERRDRLKEERKERQRMGKPRDLRACLSDK